MIAFGCGVTFTAAVVALAAWGMYRRLNNLDFAP